MSRFDGKAVLVTGAAQGIGRAIAERFLAEGAAVTIFDLDGELAEATAAELASAGPVQAFAGDVASRADVRARRRRIALDVREPRRRWSPTPASPTSSRSSRSPTTAGSACSTST